MSNKDDQNWKEKLKRKAYAAADKTGHFLRKAGPYILTGLVVIGTTLLGKSNDNNDNSTDA